MTHDDALAVALGHRLKPLEGGQGTAQDAASAKAGLDGPLVEVLHFTLDLEKR